MARPGRGAAPPALASAAAFRDNLATTHLRARSPSSFSHNISGTLAGAPSDSRGKPALTPGTDFLTALAFVGVVTFSGLNQVGARASNAELAPLWGAGLRFLVASAILMTVALRVGPLPRGRELRSAVLFGFLGFGASYGLVYLGLVHGSAGLGAIMLALVPLLTHAMASALRLERFGVQRVVAACIACIGVGVVFWEQARLSVPVASFIALAGAALAIAAANVVVKSSVRNSAYGMSAVGALTGALLLLLISVLAGETRQLPQHAGTWLALLYLVSLGSIGTTPLYVYVIRHWTASATAYALVLAPLVTIPAAAVLLREPVSSALVYGGGLVVLGSLLGMAHAPGVQSRAN